MRTTIPSKGQVVIPAEFRNQDKLVRLAVLEHKGRDQGYPKRKSQLKGSDLLREVYDGQRFADGIRVITKSKAAA